MLPFLACINCLTPLFTGSDLDVPYDAMRQVCCVIRTVEPKCKGGTSFRSVNNNREVDYAAKEIGRRRPKQVRKGVEIVNNDPFYDKDSVLQELISSFLFPNLQVVARIVDNLRVPVFYLLDEARQRLPACLGKPGNKYRDVAEWVIEARRDKSVSANRYRIADVITESTQVK